MKTQKYFVADCVTGLSITKNVTDAEYVQSEGLFLDMLREPFDGKIYTEYSLSFARILKDANFL
jgi:hypothetical protein